MLFDHPHHCGVSWPIDFLVRHLGPCSKYHVDHDFGNSSSLNGTSVSSHLVLHDPFSLRLGRLVFVVLHLFTLPSQRFSFHTALSSVNLDSYLPFCQRLPF